MNGEQITAQQCERCGGEYSVTGDPATAGTVCPACGFIAAIVGDDGTTAVRIDDDGTVSTVTITGTDSDRLDALQAACGGGYVEVVQVSPVLDVWCDEDGRSRGARPNVVGSAVVEQIAGAPLMFGFVGPVLFTSRSGERTTGLAPVELRRIVAAAIDQGGDVTASAS